MGIVKGLGIYTKGKYRASDSDGVNTKAYSIWKRMVERCVEEFQVGRNRTYVGCKLDDRFLHFQDFCKWGEQQIGFLQDGYEIDKDILGNGGKVYSPDVCVFIPAKLNKFLTLSNAARGNLPLGVSTNGNKFRSRLHIDDVCVFLGNFNTPADAFVAYKKAKEKEAKRLADFYRNCTDHRVYEALQNYEVNENE
jgi:hypothetical protein